VRWEQGRATIEQMVADGELQRVPPSRRQADRLLDQAHHHLASAAQVRSEDPAGAYALAYDAARKALAAILENQGLRATSRGGHLAIIEAVRAQLDPPLGAILRRFNRMRMRRNEAEYPPADAPELTPDDVQEDENKAKQIIELAARLLDQMSPF
jgi:HEPN domain-containing protein